MSLYIKVKLIAEDIEKGEPSEPTDCPVARALDRGTPLALGGSWSVTKDYLIWQRSDGSGYRWSTPLQVCAWIKRFDRYHGIDREGWPRRILGTRFPAISFDLEMLDVTKSSPTWHEDVKIAIEKRRSAVAS